MWFVSQIQNALSGNEPNEQCFMDSDTMEERAPSNNKPNAKPHFKSSKPSTPKNRYLTPKLDRKSSNNFLYSTECMELPSSPTTKKRDPVFEPKKPSGDDVSFETKECTVPRLLDKTPSDNVVPLKRESSRMCIKKAETPPNYNSKISFTNLNCVRDISDLNRSKMSPSISTLTPEISRMNPSACNEFEIFTTSNELESVSRPSSAKKCTQCDSVTTIVCTKCNKTEKSDTASKDNSISDITVRYKSEILKTSKDSSKLKKTEPVCVYKRDKKSTDVNVRRSFRTKKKTDDKIEKKIPVPFNQSKMEVITKSGNEKVREHAKKDFVRSKAQYQKRNEIPIHLRPLSPVHNIQPNVLRKSSNILVDVTLSPENSNIKSDYANEPECMSASAYDGLCKKVCVNDFKSMSACKDMSTSMDFDGLSDEKILPITTYRYNAKTRPSTVSGYTKIPVPNPTYCVGYSKISSVQEKVSYITGSHSQDLGNILYCQEEELRPCKGASIETPNICQKRIIQRQRSYIQPKRLNLTEPIINKRLAPKNQVSLTKPTDLIKRIEMIRRKLAEADCGDTNVDNKNISLKRSRLFYRLGERGSGTKTTGPVQDFYELRDQHLSSGTLFEDPQFPADDTSLTISRRPDRRYEWLRPGEIVDNPQLFVEGYSRFDVQQGELGDCWLLAAVANLTLYRRLFFQIVPDDQSFDENYAGIFHFRFWQYGRWVDVVIDDRLPTYRGQLVYLHSNEENEFWSALLEKAYAKLHGCYEALKGGSTCDAMEDFTGGVTEMYEMNSSPPNLFKIIMKAYERGSLMGSSLEPDPNVLEAETREGLVRGHAYSITRVKYVDIQTPNTVGKIPLLRLRNPWGNEIEWKGAWSDQSPEWRFIPDHEKENLGLTFDHDGEFWMSFKDFQKHFDRLEICNLTPDSLTEEEIAQGNKKQWEMSVFEGEWVRGVTSGGCRNYLETFWHNPQYRITLNESDDDDEEGKCTVIIALMQKNRRSRKMQGVEFLTIGFAVYYLPDPNRAPKPLDLNYFKYNASVARSPSFINLREVSCRFRLPPGTYCIVPSTFEPNDEGEFLLRVFSEHKNNMEEHDHTIALRAEKATPAAQTHPQTPTEDRKQSDQVREYFKKIAGDDMEVDWEELKDILDFATRNETKNRGFSKDVARSIVALLDEDRSGKLGFEEFVALWGLIRKSKAVFQKHDKDGTGSLNGFELREALTSVGYTLNNHILNILMHRYGNKQAEISFDDFILCGIKLKTMIEIFRRKNVSGGLSISLSFDDWIESTLYA